MKVVILDYGLGNLRSVYKALKYIGIEPVLSQTPKDLFSSDKIILPGVGHFSRGMDNLRNLGYLDILNALVTKEKIPILGICLGMQLMTNFSDEGNCEGLSWVNGVTRKFSQSIMKVPHMGWNTLSKTHDNRLFRGIHSEDYFYFVHSYYVSCNETINILSETNYGHKFVSAFNFDNIYGVQFHPEKSHEVGLNLLNNFVRLV